MKKLSFILIIFFCLFIYNCSETNEINNHQVSKDINENTKLYRSSSYEDILAITLINTGWRDYLSIINMSSDDMRNTLITELNKRTNQNISFLQKISSPEICYKSLMYDFLKESSLRSESELRNMSLEDIRNTLIVENDKHLDNQNISSLQRYDDMKLVQLGYSWYLPTKYHNLINQHSGIISKINQETPKKFGLKDNLGRSMDVLKIVSTDEIVTNKYKYLGVYHNQTQGDNFNLHLAGSNDLFNWISIKELDHDAHQGDIVKWNNGYLLAYEEDKVQGRNNIRIRYYNNYNDLLNNRFSFSKKIEAKLNSRDLEGTPDIRNFSGTSPFDGSIEIGFHYYNGEIDRLAIGVLKNGSIWRDWIDYISIYNLNQMNYKGNIGSRKKIMINNETLILQEAQLLKERWDSWRIMLGFKGFYTQVHITTPNSSSSFANPSIIPYGSNKYAVSMFLPSEGNSSTESGQLVYIK